MMLEEYIRLSGDEVETCKLRGNAYTTSSNPIVRIIMLFVAIISFLVGSVRRVIVVVTSERVIVVENQKFLWFFDDGIKVRTFYPRGIIMNGYAMKRMFLIFKTHYLSMSTGGAEELFSSKDGKDKTYEMIAAIKALKEKTSGV